MTKITASRSPRNSGYSAFSLPYVPDCKLDHDDTRPLVAAFPNLVEIQRLKDLSGVPIFFSLVSPDRGFGAGF